MAVGIVFQGLTEFQGTLIGAEARILERWARTSYETGTEILAHALPITPILTGALRGSGHVQEPVIEGPMIVVDVGFGGSAAPYAIYVHERLDAQHAPPTRAKFLEGPANEMAPIFVARLAEDVLKVFAETKG